MLELFSNVHRQTANRSPQISKNRSFHKSRALSRYFLECLRAEHVNLEVDYLDVCANPPVHVDEAFAIATYAPPHERTPAMKARLAASDALCQRVLAADALVFAMPMYNWSMPSVFKAFVDAISRAGVTYAHGPDGAIVGQLAGKKVLFITSEALERARHELTAVAASWAKSASNANTQDAASYPEIAQ
ncbi:MAG: FMN-dependent NADH-azoreductase (EC [uncultured Paraburkholderia sp.]|nr:MAG: FMN-dependent NADH-azoreductase (EC [uncultured Paraburkholderia sp.]CAH2934001.1 MAG: FMN-dependent NADH-azoreductase (EC [uncultured Paraburkholderia sp.]